MANNAISFNGSTQYGMIDNFSGLDGLTDFTMEGWVKNTTTSSAYSLIAAIEDASKYFCYLITENGTGNQGFNFATDWSTTNADGYESSTRLTQSTWVHFALAYNHTLKKTQVFINGVENNDYNLQQTGVGTITSSNSMYLRIGDGVNFNAFDGAIGGFLRLWTRALTGAEIYHNYDKTLTPANEDSSLIINCNFSEGSGSTVDNDATAGEDLDLYNSPTWVTGPTLSAKSYTNTYHFNQVAQSSDDSEQNYSGSANDYTSSDLEITYDGANPGYIGVRFDNIDIPAGATIQSAYLRFVGDETQSGGTVNATIKGHDVDDSNTFTSSSSDISGRYTGSPTTASVSWSSIGVSSPGVLQSSPDVSTIVQEIIDRGGWASGQAMSFLLYGSQTTKRTFESYDGQPYSAAMLHVEYTTGSSETATLSPVSTTFTVVAVTAIAIFMAALSPVATTYTVPATTASYAQVETVSVAPALSSFLVPSTTATSVISASTTPVVHTYTVTPTTATYDQVESAVLSPVSTSFTIPNITASYSQVSSAVVSPTSTTFSIPGITATYTQVETPALSPISTSFTVPGVTATYSEIATASLSPLSTTYTIPSTTATYAGVYNASVSPLVFSFSQPSTVAKPMFSATAPVVVVSFSIPDVSPSLTYEATVSPIPVTFTNPSITASYSINAVVGPIVFSVTIPSINANYVLSATASPASLTLTVVNTTAQYYEVVEAVASPISVSFTIPSVTVPSPYSASITPSSIIITPVSCTATYISVYSASCSPVSVAFTSIDITLSGVWSIKDKTASSWSTKAKTDSEWSNKTKQTGDWINKDKIHDELFLAFQDDDNIIFQDGDIIHLGESTSVIWTNKARESGGSWTNKAKETGDVIF